MNQKVFGELIKTKRKEKNLTQQELADQLMISSYKTISKWETGICMPDISLLPKISKLLDVSLYELLGGTKEHNVEEVLKTTISTVDEKNKKFKKLKTFMIILIIYLLIISCLFGYKIYQDKKANYVISPYQVKLENYNYNGSILSEISFYNFYTFNHHGIITKGIEDELIRRLPLYKTKIGDTAVLFEGKKIIYNFALDDKYAVTEKEINKQYKDDYYTKKAMYVVSAVLYNQVAGLEKLEFIYKDTSYKIDINNMKKYFKFIERQSSEDINGNYVIAKYIDFDSNLDGTYSFKEDVIKKLDNEKFLDEFFKK